MLRIAICDDEFDVCSALKKVISDYCTNIDIDVEILIFIKGEQLEKELESKRIFDVIFLDIDLKTTTGIKIGKKIRSLVRNERIKIVYISWNTAHAMDLFDIRPFNFLIKPLDRKKVIAVLNQLLEVINVYKQNFCFNTSGKTYNIPLEEIICFESDNRQIKILTLNGEMEYYGKLKDVLASIDNNVFLQVHRSYVINYNHIQILEYDKITMVNGIIIPISQPKRKVVRSYHLEKMKR